MAAAVVALLSVAACQTTGWGQRAAVQPMVGKDFRLSWDAPGLEAPSYERIDFSSGAFLEAAKYTGDNIIGRQAALQIRDMNGRMQTASRIADVVGIIAKTKDGGLPDARKTGIPFAVQNPQGTITGTPFRSGDNNCLAFSQIFRQYQSTVIGKRDSQIIGYYCAKKGEPLSKDV